MADPVVKYAKPNAHKEETASLEEITFGSNNRSKTVNILAAVVVILTILLIIFVALFANEVHGNDGDCNGQSRGGQGQFIFCIEITCTVNSLLIAFYPATLLHKCEGWMTGSVSPTAASLFLGLAYTPYVFN